MDCASLHVIGQVDAGGTVWSMATRPDGRGLMAGCGDQSVKFFDFTVIHVLVCMYVGMYECINVCITMYV